MEDLEPLTACRAKWKVYSRMRTHNILEASKPSQVWGSTPPFPSPPCDAKDDGTGVVPWEQRWQSSTKWRHTPPDCRQDAM